MKKHPSKLLALLYTTVIFILANSAAFTNLFDCFYFLFLLIPLFILIQFLPAPFTPSLGSTRLASLTKGTALLSLFLFSAILTVLFVSFGISSAALVLGKKEAFLLWSFDVGLAIIIEGIVFVNGILRVYLSSTQLGLRLRIIGVLCVPIPIAHLIVLLKIIYICKAEVSYETKKLRLNIKRASKQICKTKYPILLVHGVFFRDWKHFKYWGRIPQELEKNGALIFYGNHQSALSVAESGIELSCRIEEIRKETGADKVNIIAHSKGGLDSRYAISKCGMAPYVASLTTINTPHRGCEFADYLLYKIPKKKQLSVAKAYNKALIRLGDTDPDFLSAVKDLTTERCKILNEEIFDSPLVYYQSVGSKLNHATGGRFPLNFSYSLVRYFDGPNDGLVGEKSFSWGEHFQILTAKGKRGISHGDMVDMNRENFDGFDVREYYVELVKHLKQLGF